MQEKELFEYAIIRIVPKVEREEFLNVGVILYCAKKRFLQAVYILNKEKILAFSSDIDLEAVEHHLQAFKDISIGATSSGPIGKLDAAGRFRWLTATRSTMVQTSKVHPGFCTDPALSLTRLYHQLVL